MDEKQVNKNAFIFTAIMIFFFFLLIVYLISSKKTKEEKRINPAVIESSTFSTNKN